MVLGDMKAPVVAPVPDALIINHKPIAMSGL